MGWRSRLVCGKGIGVMGTVMSLDFLANGMVVWFAPADQVMIVERLSVPNSA
jgi:hypothetical protein